MINDKPPMDALAHYGVKGMKWGVRRQIKKDYRNAARLNKQYDKYSKKANKARVKADAYSKKKESLSEKGKSTKKVDKKIEKSTIEEGYYSRKAKAVNNYKKTLLTDISYSDINKGKKYVDVWVKQTPNGLIISAQDPTKSK